MVANMTNDKKLNPIVTELFIRGRKLNISIVFLTQSYFKLSKDVRLHSTLFYYENSRQNKLQQIALNHASVIDLKDFIKIYKKCTAEPYSVLVNDTTFTMRQSFKIQKKSFKINIYHKIMAIDDQIKDEKL